MCAIEEKKSANRDFELKLQRLLEDHNEKLVCLVSINDGLELSRFKFFLHLIIRQQMRTTYVELIKHQCKHILELTKIYPIQVSH